MTAGEGQTGRLIIDLLATDDDYVNEYEGLTVLVFSVQVKSALEEYDAVKTVVYDPNDEEMLVKAMPMVDTYLVIPPARKVTKLRSPALSLRQRRKRRLSRTSSCSQAWGADYAERDKQPRLREFIDLEALAMQPKGDPSTGDAGHVIHAGFYAENLLLYSKQAQGEGKLRLPDGENHKFAPIALGDVTQLAAYVMTSEAVPELAVAPSQASGAKMEFEGIDEGTAKIVNSEQGEEVDADTRGAPAAQSSPDVDRCMLPAQRECLLEYYSDSLVREGKTNYTATTAMLAYFGRRGKEPTEFSRRTRYVSSTDALPSPGIA
ncbi:hypothetical protein BV20DRAFT_704975 [Pilatotrama ljubarskyi]|nr:hypothetical protein BV20DRAFT_704975 [Pilatotrama ljubarskyi]